MILQVVHPVRFIVTLGTLEQLAMLHQVSLESGGVDSGEVALRAAQL
jgi:hypothetical protein